MKKALSLLLCIVTIFTIAAPVFAADTSMAISDESQTSSFVDAEGKVNTVKISTPQVGSAYVEYYIEDVLINTVSAIIPDSGLSRSAPDEVIITYSDIGTGTTQQFTELISEYITSQQTVLSPATRAFTHLGIITYKPSTYDSSGNPVIRSLSVSQQAGTTTNAYKTINSAQGVLASVAIAVVAAVLTVVCPALAAVATDLYAAAAYAVGVTIVGGVVQGAITKQYYVLTTPYTVRATYTTGMGSTSHDLDAARYQVALAGGGYSSDYYYEGCMPWNTSPVAGMLYNMFWSDGYPGVSSYS